MGEILVARGYISREQLESVLQKQKVTPNKRLGEILVEDGILTQEQLNAALAERLGVESIDLGDFEIDSLAASMVPEKLARRYGALPIKFLDENTLLVAMVDPTNVFAIDDLRMMTGYDIKPAVATAEEVFNQIAKIHRMSEQVGEDISEGDFEGESEAAEADIRDVAAEAPIVKLVNGVISQGVDDGASDLHFEPQEKEMLVRFRVDGVLHEIMSIPKRMQSGVLSRIKVMADIDIAERRIPQDGRIGLIVGGKPIDIRVATMPTVHGEKIVLRLLDKSSVLLDLADLGFSERALVRFETSYRKPYGAILVTGPTGSGKSTTLYATLNVLNTKEKNIITVEDPVEYRMNGINQTQINPKAGLTFASGLRAILRSDPDIVMVGEIRDKETAQIAIEAALTGHMVLSTLHTNDAPGALTRLTEMGIEPFLTASAIECVLAQRLARKLCPACKEPFKPTEEALRLNGFPLEAINKDTELYRSRGCPKCSNTGYKGRLGLYEVMLVSEAIERLTVERKSADEISRVAQAEGMMTLREDGIEKVLQGKTSMEEIARVIV
ncbi:MAG: type II secretion system protein GspE [Gaiellales bacterium]|nr:MAG: type II secretion system protein GspE [Gaiellales bacterium]